ncbi:oligopeptide/dipeptide ABC transporter, ATP-binding protein [Halovivax ruber XH-70]|uniref:Oligopeptide/dipeptide ABC transporter, ATP-binding protein n=1 Tax=Halovivax ruber (strain DSM 18193 / JCM 13892 / XH-70) TaxID=797302 RepID=L0IBU1_HALRX|nr:ABC transporter ATP-binding protein [Halovivax ruber]AGB15706.1 oligopeptide/dipeptide ABC transporter, ATP-binding protein [Halovivax ruber XH-70]
MSQNVVSSDSTRTPQTAETMIEVDELKTYYEGNSLFGGTPVKAVDGVTFDIQQGETLGLVGESGCGKTTLGRTLIQLEEATGGEIRFDGKDITTLSRDELHQWRKNAQMVFQDPDSSLNDRMTIGEIVREPLDVHEIGTPRERRQKVKELLDTVGLQREHYFRYPHQFSGGQRQRIGIARTLALEPDFIVLDEPVSALDVSVQAEIINLLEDLQEEFGLTYLFIAHDLSVVRHICDRVAVMYLGNIMEIGPTEELFTDPANPYTHSLLSAIPEPDPTAERDRITLHGTPPNPRYPPSGCPFSTRCPVAIKPEEFSDLDPNLWTRIVQLREVLGERLRADRSVRERIRERLGKETRFGTMEETVNELFGEFDLPTDVETEIHQIAHLAQSDGEAAALERYGTVFGSICDQQDPHFVEEEDAADEGTQGERTAGSEISGPNHQSYCHRHKAEFDDPEAVIKARDV